MNRKRITVLGGLALGCGLLAVAPAIAGAGDTALQAPGASAAATASAAAAVVPADFEASLSGGQETPGNASPAFGQAQFWIGEDGTSLNYSARVFGLANPVAAHLHLGPAGTAGPIVVPLQVPDQPGTSGCVAVISGGITQLEPPSTATSGSDGSAPTSGEEACAAIVPAPSPTTPTTHASTTSAPSTSAPTTSTGGGSSTTSGVTTSTGGATTTTMSMPTATTAPGAAVAFRPEDEACRALLRPGFTAPTTSTTGGSTTTTGPTTSSSSGSTSTSGASTSTSGASTSSTSSTSAPSTTTSGPSTTTTAPTSTFEDVCGFADVSGTITDADLTGPLAGETVASLLTEIRAGNIYANFHTMAFPAGEIRGQLVALNPPASTTTTTAPTTSTSGATTSTSTGPTTSTTSSGPTTSTTSGPTTSTTSSGPTTSTTSSGPTTSTTGGSTSTSGVTTTTS